MGKTKITGDILCFKILIVIFLGTIFAYGQTGSGKTFSIFGPELSPEKQLEPESLDAMGIIPRCSFFLFQSLGEHPKVKSFELKVSCLEIYVGVTCLIFMLLYI